MNSGYRIFGFVIAALVAASLVWEYAQGGIVVNRFMMEFMVLYFVTFGVFKLFDISGFVKAYARYDIITERFHAYGYIFPFVEIAIGIGYFLSLSYANYLTIGIALIGIVSVVRQMIKRSHLQCVCLGTQVNMPLGGVSLGENIAMGAMAIGMMVSMVGMSSMRM